MKLSQLGEVLSRKSSILNLMEDLGEALHNNPSILCLGGGNPAEIPQAQAIFEKHFQALANDPQALRSALGAYQSPAGNLDFLDKIQRYLAAECGWPVSIDNLAFVGGSQCALFLLFNLFAGTTAEGDKRQVVLPMVPEYLGYRSQGAEEGLFRVYRPNIEKIGQHRFKYRVDLDSLDLSHGVGAVCVSRPTNPSTNVIADSEMQELLNQCREYHLPLIVDLAYGNPFPGLTYKAIASQWQTGMVFVLSLSKLGLPGLRGAVLVADPEVIDLFVRANTSMHLADGNLGSEMMGRLLTSGDLAELCHNLLPDYYRQQRDALVAELDQQLSGLPYRIHEPEGAFFVWLWFEGLPISSAELYQRLKDREVLVMAGEGFFFGLEDHWDHAKQCVRLSYCQPVSKLRQAVARIAEELNALYRV